LPAPNQEPRRSALVIRRLKRELERKLNRARSANLIQRIQAAQGLIERLGWQTNPALPHEPIKSGEIGMVKQVEKLATELKIDSFREVELAMQGKIHLLRAVAVQHVATQGSLCLGRSTV
jgi:hypothetical protein